MLDREFIKEYLEREQLIFKIMYFNLRKHILANPFIDLQRIKKPSVEKRHVYLIRFIRELHYKQKANA